MAGHQKGSFHTVQQDCGQVCVSAVTYSATSFNAKPQPKLRNPVHAHVSEQNSCNHQLAVEVDVRRLEATEPVAPNQSETTQIEHHSRPMRAATALPRRGADMCKPAGAESRGRGDGMRSNH